MNDQPMVFPWAGGCGWVDPNGGECGRPGLLRLKFPDARGGMYDGYACELHVANHLGWVALDSDGETFAVKVTPVDNDARALYARVYGKTEHANPWTWTRGSKATSIVGTAAMVAALTAAGQQAHAGRDKEGRDTAFVSFADGAVLELRDFDSGDWEYALKTPTDEYGGSAGITGQDILDMVLEVEAPQRGVADKPHEILDRSDLLACDACGHDKLEHAFFLKADGSVGEPAPLCMGQDCECEGFIDRDQGIANEIATRGGVA